MPDTKIHRTPQGWIDDDEPTVFHSVRRLARDARRAAHQGVQVQAVQVTAIGAGTPYAQRIHARKSSDLNTLQKRLYERLTKNQGVLPTEALEVLKANGYNATASYGYIRTTGATHNEAKEVIALQTQAASLRYFTLRSGGHSHLSAMRDLSVLMAQTSTV